MGFQINTNIAAMNAHMNAVNNNKGLDKSLAALSSGLRINTAADDASGMSIANQLRSQANGLGQAIRNANDGINVAQTADGALEEYTNIINTIRTKSIQAASDGQNDDSRKAIQADITKLLKEANNIAKTTSFNGQNLLDGGFQNKKFHIGAYASETVGMDIKSAKTDQIGEVTTVENKDTTLVDTNWDKDLIATVATDSISSSAEGMVLDSGFMKVNGEDITTALNRDNPNSLLSAKSVAAAISETTDMVATAKTEMTATAAVGAGAIDESTNWIKVNGINIGDVSTVANDSDGALTAAINKVSDLTGVTAENVGGKLKLTAEDGSNINLTMGNATAVGLANSTADTLSGFTAEHGTQDVTAADITNLGGTAVALVTIAEGDLIINGVDMAGTYGDGSAGSAGQQVLEKIRDIDGMEDSYFTNGAAAADASIALVVNNGNDLNVAGTEAKAAGAWTGTALTDEGILNNSKHGDVNIASTDKVVIGGTNSDDFAFTNGGFTPKGNGIHLDSIDVTTRNGAEMAIMITDSALKEIDALRSNIGSTQNQLESTVRNISVTQVNVTASESSIRDVDFALESANLKKHNILAQAGTYALSQANAAQQNISTLLR